MSILGSQTFTGTPPGNAPTWNTTPAPAFADEAVAENYDLDQHTSGATSYGLNGGSASLPTGVTISGSNLAYDGLGSDGATAGIIIDATNAVGSTASSSFSITIIPTASISRFPIFDFYKALVESRGGAVIPATNTRFWDTPVYPTSADSTSTTVSAFNTAIATATAGDTLFLQNGLHSGKITIGVSGTQSNPITIAAATKLGVDMSGSEIQVDGEFINVMGFDDARYDINGDDNVVAYCRRIAVNTTDWVADGDRNRLCYSTFQGHTENVQNWDIVAAGIHKENRIDHNHFLQHQGNDTPGGGSEYGQVGQFNLGDAYWLYYDSNYHYQHLNDGAGNKTVSNESECVSLKSDLNMFVNNVFEDCNSHTSIRAGRKCTIYANWYIGSPSTERMGGVTAGGTDNLIACNYFDGTNQADKDGEGILDIFGGDPAKSTREEADRNEIAFNTGWEVYRGMSFNRTSIPTDPSDCKVHANAIKEASTRDVVWRNNSTGTDFGANVFGPNKGIVDADVVEAIPAMDSINGFQVPTSLGNCNGTADDISVMGPLIKGLDTAGMLVDILGSTITSTNADMGAIQRGGDLTPSPVDNIKNAAGHAPT